MRKFTIRLLTLVAILLPHTAVFAKKIVEKGDTVKVHYTGKLRDGRIFDSSTGKEPLEFVAGAGQMIAGFDAAVIGMVKKDKKTVEIPASKAYGAVDTTKVFEIPKDRIPAELAKVGEKLSMNTGYSNVVVKIIKIDEKTITVDSNHMLAGKDLVFDIEMVSVEKPKKTKAQK